MYDDDDVGPSSRILAANLKTVRVDECEPWASGALSADVTAIEGGERSPFPVNQELNRKLYLYEGDLCAMEVDAIVNFTSEKYAESTGPAGRVLALGGDDLREELEALERCRSGEVRMTKAFNMNCQKLIHTVGPNYKAKYKTAAENTLHACYRESLKLCVENDLHSVAFPCFYSDRRGYPKDECVHLTLRSVRRWLERLSQKIDTVVFVTSRADEIMAFRETLPLYFPRTVEEETSARLKLPEDVGNEFGETEVEERRIKLSAGPLINRDRDSDSDDDLANAFDTPSNNRDEDFDEASKKRLETTAWDANTVVEAEHIYLRYLRASANMDFSTLEQMKFCYTAGVDRYNRSIIVLLGQEFPADRFSSQFLLHYLIRKLDKIVREKYVWVYVNTGVGYANHPSFGLLKEMYTLFNMRYVGTMEQFMVVHPGFFFKAAFSCAFVALDSSTWQSTVYIERVQQLEQYFDVSRLELPQYVMDYDRECVTEGTGVLGSLGNILFG